MNKQNSKKIVKDTIKTATLFGVAFFNVMCSDDSPETDRQVANTLVSHVITRSAEKNEAEKVNNVYVADSVRQWFSMTLTFKDGNYASQFVADLFILLYYDTESDKPCAEIISVISPYGFYVESVDLAEDIFVNRYKLHAIGRNADHHEYSGTDNSFIGFMKKQ